MIVVDKKPVPMYETECFECHSKIQYKASEVFYCHITCPVCGTSLWANTIHPVDKVDGEDAGEMVKIVRCKKCKHRDPEDRRCDSGGFERAGCKFPVADDYFCAYGEE